MIKLISHYRLIKLIIIILMHLRYIIRLQIRLVQGQFNILIDSFKTMSSVVNVNRKLSSIRIH